MDNKKRAIILDMDETLEHGISGYDSGLVDGRKMMVLRPNLDELIRKLQEAKEQGIDIVLCTTAKNQWVERFLTLKPEFRTLFDRILTRDNEYEWKRFNEEENPIEARIGQIDDIAIMTKPVTTFGYDSVLYIDDHSIEGKRLKQLFEFAQGSLERDVTYFSGFRFHGGIMRLYELLGYKKVAIQNPEVALKLKQYLEMERNEPGCNMMCSVIDTFMSKDFTPGLTLADEEYSKRYEEFSDQRSLLLEELKILQIKLKKQVEKGTFGYSEEKMKIIEEYLQKDRKYPFEGIEIEEPEVSKRQGLSQLVKEAISTQKKIGEAENLKRLHQEQANEERTGDNDE